MTRKKKEITVSEQLLLFEEPLEGQLLRELKLLKEEFKQVKESATRVRKGQFAKIGEMQKKYDDLKAEFEIIKNGLCKVNERNNTESKILKFKEK